MLNILPLVLFFIGVAVFVRLTDHVVRDDLSDVWYAHYTTFIACLCLTIIMAVHCGWEVLI